MFTRFVYDLLNFRARKFPEKFETREPRKFIVERTLYASTSSAIMDLSREKEVAIEVIFVGHHEREKYRMQNCV